MKRYKIVYYDNLGNKIIIEPNGDTLFGATNHRWRLAKSSGKWLDFKPRVTRSELTLEWLGNYFGKKVKIPSLNTKSKNDFH